MKRPFEIPQFAYFFQQKGFKNHFIMILIALIYYLPNDTLTRLALNHDDIARFISIHIKIKTQ